MSIDYDVSLAVGFRVGIKELEAFAARTGAMVHEEPRWDPTTGAPAAPATIVDKEETTVYRLEDEEFEYAGDLADAVAALLGCAVSAYSHMDGDSAYVFGPELETDDEEALEDGRFTVGGGVALAALGCAGFADELRRIRAGLVGLGIDPGEARVAPVWMVG